MVRTFGAADFAPDRVAGAKGGRTVSVVIPARDEEATVGAVVGAIRRSLVERHHVVDELVVVDDGSTDATGREAAAHGAAVIEAGHALGGRHPGHGKGEAMWQGVHATSGDVVAFCDADVSNFTPAFVLGLVGPLLLHGDLAFVKATYRRPYHGRPGEGGRVTELAARPAMALLFPELAGVTQPLAGECAARREVLEKVPFAGGYGVDVGLLIDVARGWGPDSIAQCDLGERVHRNRPLAELAPQARTVLAVIMQRAGVAVADRPPAECPPLVSVPSYRRSA